MNTLGPQQDLFASLGLAGRDAPSRGTNNANELGLNTFLKLMVTQLNNQDPFKPMENGEFLSQIAQFGSVTGLEQLNENFEDLAGSITSNQALQAGALVGREILAPVDTGYLAPGGSLRGQIDLEQSSPQVTVRITDRVGQLVREMPMGSAPAGPFKFTWDGLDGRGAAVPAGHYRVQVQALQNDSSVDMQTKLFARVESVNLSGRDGLTLNLEGLGPVSFNNIQQIF